LVLIYDLEKLRVWRLFLRHYPLKIKGLRLIYYFTHLPTHQR
jgi:hypothetical protein